MTEIGQIRRVARPVVGAVGLPGSASAALAALQAAQEQTPAPGPSPAGAKPKASGRPTYTNPVFPRDAPDPSVLLAHDGLYYAYTTETAGLMFQVLRSKDLIKWESLGSAFKGAGPAWISKHRWAPDVKRTGDHYTMLYAGRGHDGRMRIGYATSPNPQGPFTDRGVLIESKSLGYNIDPFLKKVGNKWILYYGSTGGKDPKDQTGISAVGVAIAADGSMKLRGAPSIVLSEAGDRELVEGAWVHERDGVYYLFYSDGVWDSVDGANDYAVKVARSTSPMGPFEKQSAIVHSQGNGFFNVGHSTIITDKSGRDWIMYHAYGPDRSTGRMLMLDPIDWVDGWPVIRGGSGPSMTPMEAPVANARSGAQQLKG